MLLTFYILALSHLSSLVKKELAKVLLFEAHPYKNTISNYFSDIIFNSRNVILKIKENLNNKFF